VTSKKTLNAKNSQTLTTISRSRSFIDWQNRRTLIEDLEGQRRAIANQVFKADFSEALDLMWQFMALANSIYGALALAARNFIGIKWTASTPADHFTVLVLRPFFRRLR
jgi:Family of unknown function (DUF6880)